MATNLTIEEQRQLVKDLMDDLANLPHNPDRYGRDWTRERLKQTLEVERGKLARLTNGEESV